MNTVLKVYKHSVLNKYKQNPATNIKGKILITIYGKKVKTQNMETEVVEGKQ